MVVVMENISEGEQKVQVLRVKTSVNNKPLTSESLTCGGIAMQDG